ncbi:MAG: 16S rRNA (guanine(966)-N(2))-methyltransferase RsmD [Deltaproteobacteria bacterium]|nr:16S rRNA (guanine(966)-N(2))-methyltransferase RsmD [Deltaproteobacteria bacterium]
MRVIGGRLRGRKLYTPRGLEVRPTSDRVREAIFNILRNHIQGENVLDLFAGTGALGIEALSRGAQGAVFVEKSARSLAVLTRNLAVLGLLPKAEVLPLEVSSGIRVLQARGRTFGLVFLDPPYEKGLVRHTLAELDRSPILASGAVIVAEHSPAEEWGPFSRLQQVDQRKYGGTEVSIFRPAPDPLRSNEKIRPEGP